MSRAFTPHDLWRIARVGAPAVSRSGEVVIAGVTSYDLEKNEGRERLHLFAPGGVDKVVTADETSSAQPALSPDGRRLAFVRKPPGKEHPQLHLLPLDGGEARVVTDLPLGVGSPRWMPDGERLLVLGGLIEDALTVDGTRRLLEERAKDKGRPYVTESRVYRFWDRWLDGEVLHLFLVDPSTGEVRDLIPESRHWFDLMDADGQFDVAPDGTEVVFSASTGDPPRGWLRQALFAVGTAPGSAVRCLTPDNPADDVRPRYLPGGRAILFGTKRDHLNYADRVRLARIDRESLVQTTLTEAWDRSATTWELADDTTAVLEVEERGRSCLYRIDVSRPGGEAVLLSDEGSWHGPQPAADGHVYAVRSTLRQPPEVTRIALAGGRPETLSHVAGPALAEVELGRVEEMTFAGSDGAPIQMWVVYPPGYRGGPMPLLQVVHGGPYGAFGDGWHFRWNAQALVAPGYVAAFVNFHGSSGFGHEFADRILGDWGGRPPQDVLAATDVLVERGIADPARVAVLGGSYGGYLTAWLAGQTNRFACAVAHAAVYNFVGGMAADVTQGFERELGGAPWLLPAEKEGLFRFDPSAWTETYRTPTLVIHGAKDYRVPVEQGLALYGMLKARDVPARLVVYPEENHWILKPRSSLHWYAEVHAWLARWLRP